MTQASKQLVQYYYSLSMESRRAYRHLQTLSGRRSVHVLVFLWQGHSDSHQSVLLFEIVRFSWECHVGGGWQLLTLLPRKRSHSN